MKDKFTEAIKFKDGVFYNLPYHQSRMDRTMAQFGMGKIELAEELKKVVVPTQEGLYKCRVLYHERIESIEFTPYSFQKKEKVGIVVANEIDYSYKFANRENLEKLIADTELDDILIVKNGFVTDALFSNLVFESEEGLFTPVTYLLAGTKRQYLLDNGQIKEKQITLKDVHTYKKICFINAMIDLEDEVFVKTERLIL